MTNTIYLGQAMMKPTDLIDGAGVVVGGSKVVQMSIEDILCTPRGTRFMLPEYGSRLHELLHEPNDEILEAMLRTFIFEAIRDWEGRAKFVDVTFATDEAKCDCHIYYRELPSNEIKSFVFPYYRELIY